jgi:hypothetical protein
VTWPSRPPVTRRGLSSTCASAARPSDATRSRSSRSATSTAILVYRCDLCGPASGPLVRVLSLSVAQGGMTDDRYRSRRAEPLRAAARHDGAPARLEPRARHHRLPAHPGRRDDRRLRLVRVHDLAGPVRRRHPRPVQPQAAFGGWVNGCAYVPYVTRHFRGGPQWIAKGHEKPGDLEIFAWGGAGRTRTATTSAWCSPGCGRRHWEGNSAGPDGYDEVAQHRRGYEFTVGFVRPSYGHPQPPAPPRPAPIVHPKPAPASRRSTTRCSSPHRT